MQPLSLPVELLLGSQSPRRRALIQLLGFPVYSQAADADEEAINEPDPALNAVMTA
jgi:predicted house-cleaning NTP pyrophosphatase (Maf/HAM1 superfamily)